MYCLKLTVKNKKFIEILNKIKRIRKKLALAILIGIVFNPMAL